MAFNTGRRVRSSVQGRVQMTQGRLSVPQIKFEQRPIESLRPDIGLVPTRELFGATTVDLEGLTVRSLGLRGTFEVTEEDGSLRCWEICPTCGGEGRSYWERRKHALSFRTKEADCFTCAEVRIPGHPEGRTGLRLNDSWTAERYIALHDLWINQMVDLYESTGEFEVIRQLHAVSRSSVRALTERGGASCIVGGEDRAIDGVQDNNGNYILLDLWEGARKWAFSQDPDQFRAVWDGKKQDRHEAKVAEGTHVDPLRSISVQEAAAIIALPAPRVLALPAPESGLEFGMSSTSFTIRGKRTAVVAAHKADLLYAGLNAKLDINDDGTVTVTVIR